MVNSGAAKGPITVRVFGLGTQCPWTPCPYGTLATPYRGVQLEYTPLTAALFASSVAVASIPSWVGEDSDGSLS